MIDLTALESLARAATPGPWKANLHHTKKHGAMNYGFIFANDLYPVATVTLGVEGMPEDEGRANARFIAALSPDVVLRLVEMARRR